MLRKKNYSVFPASEVSQTLWELVLFYRSLSLNLFAIPLGTKRPELPWKVFQERLATWDELSGWFSNHSANIAVLCGSISLGLFIQDFERREDAREFYPNFEELLKSTLVDETPHGGIHVWGQTSSPPRRKIRLCEEHPLDILGEGGYALAPPSMVDGKQYRFVSSAKEILWVTGNPLTILLNRCKELHWKTRVVIDSNAREATACGCHNTDRTLTEERRAKIVNALVPFWARGRRHEMTIYLLGFLMKQGIAEEESETVLRAICEAAGDEEIAERLKQVSYHYVHRASLLPRLKGWVGLQEVLGDATID
jgi:hypothetical protein